MSKLTKKQKAQQGKIIATKLYPFGDALALVKEFANAKFDESIDVGPSRAWRCCAAQRNR